MCGITGFWNDGPVRASEARATVDAMSAALAHRGPDDQGRWLEPSAGIVLGHRRLSIVDLSPGGHQPMTRIGGRHVLAYNGEVYNHAELRDELRGLGARFRGTSDTEVVLAAMDRWGVREAIERLNGMFALAVWDRAERRLTLVRDRLGIKPLYYGFVAGALLFGSELNPLRAYPGFHAPVDREALAAYMRYNVVPARRSIYRGIHKLPPGCFVQFRHPAQQVTPRTWWAAPDVVAAARQQPFRGSEGEAVEALDALLRDAVKRRMVADVPLGAFLSGGIDSSSVVALMQAQSAQPVRTFTIGFDDAAYNEADDARRVAEHLGASHTEQILRPQDALDVVPTLPRLFDEPFADSSQVPMHLVSRLARQHVTVALSGDGGDELFGGYNRHTWAPQIWKRTKRVPQRARRWIGRALSAVPPWAYDGGFEASQRLLPDRMRVRTPGDKMHKLASILGSASPQELYRTLVSHWERPLDVVKVAREAPADNARGVPSGLSFAEQMMLLDLRTYLPDDILTKVDRASMAVGLEARVPLLDHRVVSFAWSLPLELKIRNGQGKRALRKVLDRYVPRPLVDRAKMGFGLPIDRWLRGPLRPWAEALLAPERIRREGFLHPEPITEMWRSHLSGRVNAQHALWDVLMFQAWHEATLPAG